jgi:hypothetical protein
MWAKYSSIANDRCPDVYAMRTPGSTNAAQSEMRRPRRVVSWNRVYGESDRRTSTHAALGDAAEHVLHGSRARLDIDHFERCAPAQGPVGTLSQRLLSRRCPNNVRRVQ